MMNSSPAFSSLRLNQARRLLGLSLDDLVASLAEAGLSITKQSLSKYEKGEIAPSSQSLAALSKVLKKPIDFFFQKGAIKLVDIDYRRVKSRLSAKAEARIVAHSELYFEKYIQLESIISGSKYLSERKYPVCNGEEAEAAANHLRFLTWKIGKEPIQSVTKLLEKKHIKICRVKEDQAFDALRAYAKNELVICSNKQFLHDHPERMDLPRMRFTILHELAHDVLVFPDKLTNRAKESLCHRFAGAFLLPKISLFEELGEEKRSRFSLAELVELKGKFGISLMAIGMRLFQCGLMTQQAHKSFSIQYRKARFGISRDEPGRFRGNETPSRMKELISEAYASGSINEKEARDFAIVAGMSPEEQDLMLEVW
ncbi:Helix-turn-helix domain protein [Verrucomicrobiia bacterium DG1235]|nr:Helix-turn-helix domain protein [Verrucomicrobiae bacterium DG1235]